MAASATADAAGGLLLACAVLLLFGFQSSSAQSPPPIDGGSDIVRIYSGENTTLVMAATKNGEVILVERTDDENELAYQSWWKYTDATWHKYLLVNKAMDLAMTSPTGDGQPVLLAPYDRFSRNDKQLWVSSTRRPQDGDYYQIKPYTNDGMALNGLRGRVRVGTKIGIYHSPPVSTNTLWFISYDI